MSAGRCRLWCSNSGPSDTQLAHFWEECIRLPVTRHNTLLEAAKQADSIISGTHLDAIFWSLHWFCTSDNCPPSSFLRIDEASAALNLSEGAPSQQFSFSFSFSSLAEKHAPFSLTNNTVSFASSQHNGNANISITDSWLEDSDNNDLDSFLVRYLYLMLFLA